MYDFVFLVCRCFYSIEARNALRARSSKSARPRPEPRASAAARGQVLALSDESERKKVRSRLEQAIQLP